MARDPNGHLTLIQYAQAYRDEYFRTTPDLTISKAEYDRIYPLESRQQMWFAEIQDASRRGETLRREVLDDLWHRVPRAVESLYHDYPNAFPAGYVKPDVRESQRQHSEEWKAARRRGWEAGHTPLPARVSALQASEPGMGTPTAIRMLTPEGAAGESGGE
jgi:hypothetical protein